MESLFSSLEDLIRMPKEKAEKNLRECISNVRTDFVGIAKIISLYHPLEVLKLTLWEAKRNSSKKDKFIRASLNLMPFLLQSVVVSKYYDATRISQNRNIKPKDWNRLVSLTEAVTRKLIRYIDNLTVFQVKTGTIAIEEAKLYREYLAILYIPPFETRERIAAQYYPLKAAMQSAEERIKERFGVSSEDLSSGFKAIAEDSIDSIDRLLKDFHEFQTEVMDKVAEKRQKGEGLHLSDDELSRRVIRENNWQGRSLALTGKRDDFDLFRPEFSTNLPNSVYEPISLELGSVDLSESLLNGYWPASLKPFIKMGDFYFSFILKHLVSCGNRMMMETMGINDAPTRASQEACSLIFTKTDAVDVYSYDGNKIDLIVLPSLLESNPDTNPENYANRVRQREEERNTKRQIGHVLLFVDPDSMSPLEKLEESTFITSTSFLISSALDNEQRRAFLRAMFGVLTLPESEKTFAESIEDDYFLPKEYEELPDPDDDISDDYEYALSTEEEDEIIEEKERIFEQASPHLAPDFEREDDYRELKEIYELTDEIKVKDEANAGSFASFSDEIDYDDFEDDDYDVDALGDDYSDDEELYNEAESEDEYEQSSENPEIEDLDDALDPQLDFLSMLDYETAEDTIAEEEIVTLDENPEEEIASADDQREECESSCDVEETEEVVSLDENPEEETASADDQKEECESSCSDEVAEEVVSLDENPEEEFASADDQREECDSSCSDEDAEEVVALDEDEEIFDDNCTTEPYSPEDTELNEDSEDEFASEDDLDDEYYASLIVPCIEEDDSEEGEEIEIPLFAESEEESRKQTEALKEAYKDDPLFTDLSLSEDLDELDEDDKQEEPVEEVKPLSWAQSMFGDILGMDDESDEPQYNDGEDESEEFIEEFIEDSAEETIEEPAEEYVEEPVEESVEEPVEESVEESVEEPVEEPVDPKTSSLKQEEAPYFVREDGSILVKDKDGNYILKGYKSSVDDLLLDNKEEEEEKEEPYEETLDGILLKIKKALGTTDSVFLSFLEEADAELHSYLHSLFSESWQKQQQDHRDKVFTIYDYCLTVLLARDPIRDDLRLSELLNNAGAVMYSKKKEEWGALILYINDEYEVETAIEKRITKNTFSAFDWKRVMNIGEQLLARGRRNG